MLSHLIFIITSYFSYLSHFAHESQDQGSLNRLFNLHTSKYFENFNVLSWTIIYNVLILNVQLSHFYLGIHFCDYHSDHKRDDSSTQESSVMPLSSLNIFQMGVLLLLLLPQISFFSSWTP